MTNKFEKLEQMIIDNASVNIVLDEIGRDADMLPDLVRYYKDGKLIFHTSNIFVDYDAAVIYLEDLENTEIDHLNLDLRGTKTKFDEDIYTQDNKYKRDVIIRFENKHETIDFVWEDVDDGSAYVCHEEE